MTHLSDLAGYDFWASCHFPEFPVLFSIIEQKLSSDNEFCCFQRGYFYLVIKM